MSTGKIIVGSSVCVALVVVGWIMFSAGKASQSEADAVAISKAFHDGELKQQASDNAALPKRLPSLPIVATQRKALTGAGKVVIFNNVTGSPYALSIKFTRPGSNLERTFDRVVDARSVREIGYKEGWELAPGDVVEYSAVGFEPVKIRF